MNIVLQTINETFEFLDSYEFKNRNNLIQFSDKITALAFLHHIATHIRDPSILRTILIKERNGINIYQLNDHQMLEVLANRLLHGKIKVKRTLKSKQPSTIGITSEPPQYMTPQEVEPIEKTRCREPRSISNTASTSVPTNIALVSNTKESTSPATEKSAPKTSEKSVPQTLRQTGGGNFTAADELYNAIRASNTDVSTIAENTRIKPQNIQKVKDHVFYNEHLLDKYVDYGIPAKRARFDSDLNQAQAWQRLENGTYTEADITWLKHETVERWYELRHNSGYTEAHNFAENKWTGNPWKEK